MSYVPKPGKSEQIRANSPPPPPPPPSNYELGISGNNIPAPGGIRAETAVDTPRQPLDGRGMKNYAVRITTGNPARRRADPVRALGLTWAWGGVDFRPIRRWRRAAAFLMLCASLAAPLLGAGGSAQAAVLVSNLGESATDTTSNFGNNGVNDLAQIFTTGTHEPGYTLTSVEIAFNTGISAANIGDLSVSVWSVDSSGNPLTKQFDLTNPTNPAGITAATTGTTTGIDVTLLVAITGNYTVFTAPSNTTLTQNTPYAVVLTFDQHRTLWNTASDTETSAATGWSIADEGRKKPSAGSWSAISTILIRVNGEPKAAANTAPTSADKTVGTPEDTEYTFSSADFDFTDTDMGDTLLSVKIVSLPARGMLTLSDIAITSVDPEQTVAAAQIGNLSYVPPANDNGSPFTSFTFRVNDGTDNSAMPNTVTVNVTAVNDAAMGQPGIAGTARVERVLMATVGTIADPDGLPAPLLTDTNTSFQWVRVTSGTDADISGAMASTYTLVDADNGKTIRVKVSFQDDDGTNEGPLTSDAYPSGGTVLPASTNVEPTSSDRTVTATEDTEYTFSSADFVFTDTDMGDTLSSVKIVSLPARGTLTLSGTALTSGDLPQTVGAAQIGTLRYIPPANESGTALASFTFRVNDGTDDSVATYTMTVNVTAVNAETLATLMELSLSVGTLVPEFSPTHFRYRVSVAAGVKRITMMYAENAGDMVEFFLVGGSPQPLTDADPGSDTFEVDLSVGINVIRVEVTAGLPSGSVKAKSALEKVYSVSSGGPTALSAEVGKLFTALPETKTYWVTVTVGSSGGFLGPWMARFGRTVADQVLGSVGDRMTAPRTSGTEVRLAGHRLGAVDRDTGDHASGENTARAGTIGREVEAKATGKVAREAEKEAERKMAVGLRALTNQLGADGNNGNYGKSGHDGLFGGFEARAAEQKSRGLTGREMLTSSSFTLTADTAGGDHGALWGRGAVSSFDGRTGGFGLDGEVVSVILGIDRTKGPAVVGVALGHSRGEGAYRSEAGEAAHGEIATTLIGIYPYARYEVNERLSVWGVGGHGMGTMTLTPEGLAPMATNTDLVMAALGGRGVLRQPLDGIGLELAVRSDALAVRTTTKALRGSGINLAATAAEVTRLRLGLEGTWHNALPLGLVPTFEIGVRYDGGDAETGFGADLGAGLTWADPVRGIRAEFHARGLVGHEDDGFREFGLSGLLFWDAMPDSDLGWSLGIAQAMGARATGGMDALLNPDTTRVFGFDETVDSSDALHDDDLDRRLAADLGYGFAMFGGRYTGTPAVGLRLSEDGREMVLGWSLAESQKSGLVFGLDVAGRRHESGGVEPGHSFGGGFGWQRAGGRSGEPGFGVRFEGERLAADRDGEPEHRFGVQMTARW